MAQTMLNLGGNLSPEQQIQQQQIARQQKMAELLMQQGQQTPSGQMVGNRFVAPSFFQYAAPLLQGYVGRKELEKVEQRQLDMAKQLRADEISAMTDYMQQKQGRPAQPAPTGYELIDAGMPATPANPQAALANLYTNPRATQAQRQFAFQKMNEGPIKVGIEDTLIDPATMKPIFTGAGKPRAPLQIDTGTAIELRDPANPTVVLQRIPKSLSPADAARMQFEGITSGMPNMGGQPNISAQSGSAPQVKAVDEKFVPAVQPQYQYNPFLSPKANQEQAVKFAETLSKNQTNAKDSFDLMKAASNLLSSEAPSSGRLSNIVTGTREFFGGGGEASKADAQLNLLSGALTMKQPRFEGPQGVLDVTLYQKLAGDLGNPNLPIASRLATLDQMVNLQKKYYPQGDWDSISTKTQSETKTQAVKSAGKVSLKAPQYATNPTTGERIVSTDGGINWKPVGNR
jgi:hypothetical protein